MMSRHVESLIDENLVGVPVSPLALEQLVNGRNHEEGSIGYKRSINCSALTLLFEAAIFFDHHCDNYRCVTRCGRGSTKGSFSPFLRPESTHFAWG